MIYLNVNKLINFKYLPLEERPKPENYYRFVEFLLTLIAENGIIIESYIDEEYFGFTFKNGKNYIIFDEDDEWVSIQVDED